MLDDAVIFSNLLICWRINRFKGRTGEIFGLRQTNKLAKQQQHHHHRHRRDTRAWGVETQKQIVFKAEADV